MSRLAQGPGLASRAWLCVLLVALLAVPQAFLAASARAAPDAAGRWDGQAQIPGAPMPMVVDLQAGRAGQWQGSVIIPGRGVKGAVLGQLRVDDNGVAFNLSSAIPDLPDVPPARVELRWQPDGRLGGEFHQGANVAPLTLKRIGPAQVDVPPPLPALPETLAGVWRGRYELGGYPRDVSLTLSPSADGTGQGEMVIVGRRRSVLAMDRIDPGSAFVILESSSTGVRVEGRWNAAQGLIEGHFLQGPFEARLLLRREAVVP